MPKLLIVDDDAHLRKLVRTYAERDGLQCEEAENGLRAIEKVDHTAFDIAVLDVMMPGIDGFATLEKIREYSEVPVIMLTSRTEEHDRLLGFGLGADDYVPKPFSPKELMARVGAVLKRTGYKPGEALTFGTLCVEPGSRTVTVDGRVLGLTPKEFDLLLHLARNARLVLSREQLLNKVWGYSYDGDVRTVDTHVKSLREHLGEYRCVIRTVWGVGYKFEHEQGT